MEHSFSIVDLRKSMGMTQSEFALAIGLSTKSKVSEIEKHNRASVDVALAIEALSVRDGKARIDAARLNEDVAKSREACTAICHKDIQSHHGLTDKSAGTDAATGNAGKVSRVASLGSEVAA